MKDSTEKSAKEHAEQLNMDLNIPLKKRLVYERVEFLVEQSKKDLEKLSIQERPRFLFNLFMDFIKSQKWKYDPSFKDIGDNFHLLDTDSDMICVINCFDLSLCFKAMLSMAGIKNAALYIYENIVSISFAQKGIIHVEFSCFDQEYHQKVLRKKGRYHFTRHCVIQINGMYFDPTMLCSYQNANDVVALFKREEDLTITITAICQKMPEVTLFTSSFILNQLRMQLEARGWDVLLRRKFATVTDHTNDQLMVVYTEDMQHIQFEFGGIDSKTVAELMSIWLSISHPLSYHYEISLIDEKTAIPLLENLFQKRFDLTDFSEVFICGENGEPISIKDKMLSQVASVHYRKTVPGVFLTPPITFSNTIAKRQRENPKALEFTVKPDDTKFPKIKLEMAN